MTDETTPQIYLRTPSDLELSRFADQLKDVLAAVPVACVRLSLPGRDEEQISKAGDLLREIAHARDVAIVLDDHYRLAAQLGLDGVHLSDGHRHLRDARKHLGADAIVGCFCETSRHQGMTAAEMSADYISFGPVGDGSALGSGEVADAGLFEWWSEMIEVPVVAEGGLDGDTIDQLAPVADFFCLGDEIWLTDDPLKTLSGFERLLLRSA